MMPASATPDVNIALAGPLGNAILDQLNTLREYAPVHWSEASHCWLVTGHAELTKALAGELPLSCDRLVYATFGGPLTPNISSRYPTISRFMPNWIINLDPPNHTRVRKLLFAAFNRKVVEAIRPFVQERVATLMGQLGKENTIEFNEFARQLPGSVIIRLLGLPPDSLSRLRGWSNAFQEAVAVPGVTAQALLAYEDAMIDMNTVLTSEIDKRRIEPKDDLITALVKANDAGDALSLDEMLGALHVLVVAGHDTTSNSMTMGLATMIAHPESWEYMRANPDRMLDSVLELMRHMAMATSQPRIVTADFEWAGKQIKAGQLVFLMLAAGNRDPRAYNEPEKLDLSRNNDQSLTFAPGMHHCIGHLLAKMQLTTFFEELVNRFEGAEILDEKLNFMPQIAFRGLYELNVRMKPRKAN